jgi:hypothetical protein
LFPTVSDFVCTRQVRIFQSLSVVLSLRFPEARQLDFLLGASNPGSVRSHIEGCSLDFAQCSRFSWFIATSLWFPIWTPLLIAHQPGLAGSVFCFTFCLWPCAQDSEQASPSAIAQRFLLGVLCPASFFSSGRFCCSLASA